jgi:hypothetical protein
MCCEVSLPGVRASFPNVSSEWSCLCKNSTYFEKVNACTYAACNETQEDGKSLRVLPQCLYFVAPVLMPPAVTFSALAELCSIFGLPLTVGPEATASLPESTPIFNTQGIASASSLPPVVSTTNLLGSSSNYPDTLSTSNGMGSSTYFTIETIAPTSTESGGSASSGSTAGGSAVETGNAGVKDASQVEVGSVFWLLAAYLGYVVGA